MTTTQLTLSDIAEQFIKAELPKMKSAGIKCERTGKAYTIKELASDLVDEAIAARQNGSSSSNGEIVQFNHWLDLNKTHVDEIRQQIVAAVEEGNISPLEFITAIQSFSKVFIGAGRDKGVKSLLMQSAIKEFETIYGSGTHDIKNFQVKIQETGVKYDYSKDPIWRRSNNEFKAAQDKLKNREERLKIAKAPDLIKGETEWETEVDTETGEAFPVEPPTKTSTTTLNFTLKK